MVDFFCHKILGQMQKKSLQNFYQKIPEEEISTEKFLKNIPTKISLKKNPYQKISEKNL